jgi:hypothetical protein
MGRQMWPYEARWKLSVRALDGQHGKWEYWARFKAVPTPVFLALAADIYCEHLERVCARWERARKRKIAREAKG